MKKKINELPEDIINSFFKKDYNRIEEWQSEESINNIDRDGRSLLFYAVLGNSKDLLIQLLKSKPNLDLKDNVGRTALHYAAQEYLVDIAAILVDHGADIESKDNSGNNVLFRAVYESRGRGEMINLLLERGANPDLENRSGNSARSLANKIANYDIEQFMAGH